MDHLKTYEEGKKDGEMQGVILSIDMLLKDIAEEGNEQVPQALTDYVRNVTDINVLINFLVKIRKLESLNDMENFF